MIMHIQSPGIVRCSLFMHFKGFKTIFRDIDAYSVTLTDGQLVGRGEASPQIFEIEKGVLNLEREALVFLSPSFSCVLENMFIEVP